MGMDPISLAMIAMVGGSVGQFGLEKASRDQALDAAKEQAEQEQQELVRQAGFVEDDAAEETSLRAREARKQFASMVATLVEGGASAGGGNFTAFGNEIGFNADVDVSRIVANREREIAALSSRSRAVRSGFKSAEKQGQFDAIGSLISLGTAGLSAKANADHRTLQQRQTEQLGTV